ncbi:MAG: lipoprotein-releasing ABC transporter permease subunit [Marinicaulis sp.]|nr:lipoprotein-releasing ABC transporter permease subunit [Marinicaulis sp.]
MAKTNGSTGPFSFFEWMVARRYLGATRSGKGVSLISIIAFAGIMLAVATLIIVMSVMQGFRAKLLEQMLGLNGHIFVQMTNETAANDDLIAKIANIEGVLDAAPLVQAPAYATTPGGGEVALVRGMRGDDLRGLTEITGPENIRSGTFETFGEGRNGGNQIAVGVRLAASLGVEAGDGVTLTTNGGSETAFGRIPVRSKTYIVGAVFDVDNHQYDSTIIFMPFEQSKLFFQGSGGSEQIEIRVGDPDEFQRYLLAINGVIEGRNTTDWTRIIGPYFDALQIERNVMRLILMLIVAVAALNIITGLVMLVKDKTGDIAVLRTMGATQGAVMRIFFLSGALIGILGTAFGVILGALFVTYIDPIEQFLSAMVGQDLFKAEIYFFQNIPAELQMGEVVTIASWALFMSFISTILPAWRAARLDPVEALRYE